MIATRTKTTFNKAGMQKRVQAASFRSLGHAGGRLRTWASRSIRRRKTPSKPGQPPHTRKGALKRAIRYDLNTARDSVAIGPVRNAGSIWQTLEHGGRPQVKRLASTSLKIGGWGPIRRRGNGRFDRVRLRSAAQVSRARRLLDDENQRRAATGKRFQKARPFMAPALEANKDRLPKHWQNSLR